MQAKLKEGEILAASQIITATLNRTKNATASARLCFPRYRNKRNQIKVSFKRQRAKGKE
jgi:hypothetical protein